MPEQNIPEIKGSLRDFMLKVPEPIYRCSGIKILGRRIKSVLFSTDASIIRNTNADAVIAVYPFTPQPVITQAVMVAADVPVFVGVGGGLTQGHRVVNLALHAEFQGAIGVVVNAPTRNETIKELHRTIDVPIVVTVLSEDEDIQGRIDAGVSILNHISSRQNAAGRAQHQGALSGYPDNRDRRSDGGEHTCHRRSGSERNNLDSPVKRRCVQRHYGQVPPRRTPPGFLIESAARRDTPSGFFHMTQYN